MLAMGHEPIDHGDEIADRDTGLDLRLIDLDAELVLEEHHHLDLVQAVHQKVFDGRCCCHRVRIDALDATYGMPRPAIWT